MNQPAEVGGRCLVGRRREVQLIVDALGHPDGRGIALIGPAGLGKTRLADECRQLATAAGMMVVAVSANETSARLTLGALAHLLPPASQLADLHQDLQPAQLLQAARQALAERAGHRRLVISVDDAHHLDAVSAHLVHQLATTGDAFVIVTLRTGMAVPPALASLWKDGVIQRIDLAELQADDIGLLASAFLGAHVETEALRWLTQTSRGNALFLRELAIGGRDDGTLVLRDARWCLASGPHPVSTRLTELVEHRLAGLPNEQLRAVDLIALAEPIGLEIIETMVGIDVLEALDQRGLVRMVADGRRLSITLAHPLYVEALRRAPITLRRRADLGAVSAAVEACGARRREDAVRIAGWQLARGGKADPEVLLRAAIAAGLNYDEYTAIDLTTAALNHEVPPALRIELHLCRGHAESRLGRMHDALEDVRQGFVRAITPDQISRAGSLLAAVLVEGNGDLDGAVAVMDEAISRLATDTERLDLRLERATILADGGRSELAEEELRRLSLLDARAFRADQRVSLSLATASQHLGAGRPMAAIAAADAGLTDHLLHLDIGTLYHPTSHFISRIGGLVDSGNLDHALHDARWVTERSELERRPIGLIAGKVMIATVLLRRGQVREARDLARLVLDTVSSQLPRYWSGLATAVLAQCHVLLGDRRAAERSLRDLEAFRDVQDGFGIVEVALAHARAARLFGQPGASARLLWASVEEGRLLGNRRVMFECLAELVHVDGDRRAAQLLIELAPNGDGALLAVRVAQARMLLQSAGASELAALSQRYASMQTNIRAAEVAAQAAERAMAAGDLRLATRCEHLARDFRARTDVGSSTATVGLGAVVPLTDREREIALMVGRGESSKGVAASLFLSARTVDNHLQRIFAKLGVSSRKELAESMGSGHHDPPE